MAENETAEAAMPREVKVLLIEPPKKLSLTLDSMRRRQEVRKSVKKSEDGSAGGESAALDEEGGTQVIVHADVIEPPLPLEVLVRVYEESNSLRQNIDAMSTNVDGFGFEIVPSMPLEGAEADGLVADKLEDDGKEPTDDAVKERLATLVKKVGRERRRAKNFFQFCCDEGFIELRRRSRDDLEALGNFYWEVLRDKAGRISRFVHLPAYTMRLTKLGDSVDVEVKRKVDPVTFETVKEKRRCRRFVQMIGGETAWFKEFGDPRIMSRKSGDFHKSEDEIAARAKEAPDEGVATEVIHFKIPALKGPYGMPRWIGNILSVRGSRLAEEVNYFYFRKKAIPPMMIFVEDGTLGNDAVERLTVFFQQLMGETEKHWAVPVIEGESAEEAKKRGVAWSGTPRFRIERLMDQQLKDALFQSYDSNNRDKVGESFRIPRLLRGDIRDMTRACYSEDTETLTENGWKLVDEISPDERIGALNRETGAIEFVVPEEKHVYEVDEMVYRIENQHTDMLVTADHTLLIKSAETRWSEQGWRVCKAKELPLTAFDVRLAAEVGSWRGESSPSEITFPKKCLRDTKHGHGPIGIDDWMEFLGYFVSEGSLLTTNHPAAPYYVSIAQKDPENCAKIQSCIERTGLRYNIRERKTGTVDFVISNRCLRDWLISNVGTHAYDKRIPSEYLRFPEKQLRILYDALMLGDGHASVVNDKYSGVYYSCSSMLAGQVQQLAIQLGYRAKMSPHENGWCVPHCDRRVSRIVTYHHYSMVPYRGRVYCFSVPTHGFFVTRRNGKIAIQGNSAIVGKAFGEQQVFQPERDRFDNMVNRKIMPALDFKYVEFRTRAPVMRDPISLTEMVSALAKAGVLIPEEGREISEDIFNREFVRIKEPWVKQPIALTLAGVVGDEETTKQAREALGLGAPGSPVDTVRVVSRLLELREHFEDLIDASPSGTVYGALGGEERRRDHEGDSGDGGSGGDDRDD